MKNKKRKKELRTGYTTGACAAAAAKGALLCLFGKDMREIELGLPRGEKAYINPRSISRNGDTSVCEIIKDAGDDPDVTNGAVISASVKLIDQHSVIIKGGSGVGVVTRPGLAVMPGEPAINPVPLKMIKEEMESLLPFNKGVEVLICVERGEELAKKTLNPRLGIVGGISILGTTGLVLPYSHDAYRETIICAIKVIRAMGLQTVVFSTGRRSETIAQAVFPGLPEPAFVLIGDYFSFALREALRLSMRRIILSCFPGKILKIAAGADCTHCSKSSVDLTLLAGIAKKAGIEDKIIIAISSANTVRHAFDFFTDDQKRKICACLGGLVMERIRMEFNDSLLAEVLILSYNSEVLFHGRA